MAAYSAVVLTFSMDAPTAADHPVGALVATLAAGLLLYFLDAPAKSLVYRTNTPTDIISREWGYRDGFLGGRVSVANAYFVVLDEVVPGPIRARSLYMGSMFRIGYELIVLVVVASVAVTVIDLWPTDSTKTEAAPSGWCAAAAVLALLMIPFAYILDKSRGGRRNPPIVADSDYEGQAPSEGPARTEPGTDQSAETKRHPMERLCRWLEMQFPAKKAPDWLRRLVNAPLAKFAKTRLGRCARWINESFLNSRYTSQIPIIDWLLYAFAGLSLAFYMTEPDLWPAFVAAVGLPSFLFLVRNHRGHRLGQAPARGSRGLTRATVFWANLGARRKPQDAMINVVPAALAFAWGLVGLASTPRYRSLTPGQLLGWATTELLVLGLIISRGHEKRLKGTYASQAAWLRLNRSRLELEYFSETPARPQSFFTTPDRPATVTPGPSTPASDVESEKNEDNDTVGS